MNNFNISDTESYADIFFLLPVRKSLSEGFLPIGWAWCGYDLITDM
jgi:hypothetical protein